MGTPKAELLVRGQPILQFLLDRWRWPGPALLVTAPSREHPPGCELFSREVSDAIAGQGPLRGVVSALEAAGDAEIVLVTTCDMPLVTSEMLEFVAAKLADNTAALGLMSKRGDEIEPFPLAIRPAALPLLHQRLNDGQRSLHSLSQRSEFRLIEAPAHWPPAVWTNLNSPDDFRQFLSDHQA